MSNDYVSVDPERLEQAAAKLEGLRDALEANTPTITSMLNSYHGDGLEVPGLAQALAQALARAPGDAADMRARSRLAWYLNTTEPPGVPGLGQPGWMTEIPWDRQQVDQDVAPLEAQALVAAVNSRDPAAARAQIAAIAQDLADHSADLTFLRAFMSEPGVAVAMENLPGVLRMTQDGKTVRQASKSDLNNVLTVLASVAIPLGFANKNAYMNFNSTLMNGLARAGYPNAVAAFQGSSVTGIRASDRTPVGNNPGDYDIAISDPDLYDQAKNLGIGLRNEPARTDPLSEEQAGNLGLAELRQELSSQAGRPVNIMIYENPQAAMQYKPSIRVPFAYQVQNYFDKQAQKATQAEVAQEVQQAEDEEQAQLSEEEAEAEAEAEAMAMAEDDE
jgi:hypothetical protein